MMDKFESKYQNTAKLMDEALFELIDQKDFEYITIKELCKKAGVNRSTFYLHYESMNDLLSESVKGMYADFYEHMRKPHGDIGTNINDCPIEDLFLITPEYLRPYLEYIKEHKKIFKIAKTNVQLVGSDKMYDKMLKTIFLPILSRFNVDEKTSTYAMRFYISGIDAIVDKWVKGDCKDSIDEMVDIIQWCVKSTYTYKSFLLPK